jgi:hypothetical protein
MPPKAECIPTRSPSDSALLGLGEEFLRRNAEILRLGSSKDLSDQLIVRLLSATKRQRDLLRQIAALPVASIEGWRGKFRCSIASRGPAEAADLPEIELCRRVMDEFCEGSPS